MWGPVRLSLSIELSCNQFSIFYFILLIYIFKHEIVPNRGPFMFCDASSTGLIRLLVVLKSQVI